MCNAHAPYYHLWTVRLCNIFPQYRTDSIIIEKKKLLKMKCILVFSTTLSETFLIVRRIERDMIKMCIRLHLKYPLTLSDFNETDFFDKFSKNTQISNLIKIHPVGGEFFHAD